MWCSAEIASYSWVCPGNAAAVPAWHTALPGALRKAVLNLLRSALWRRQRCQVLGLGWASPGYAGALIPAYPPPHPKSSALPRKFAHSACLNVLQCFIIVSIQDRQISPKTCQEQKMKSSIWGASLEDENVARQGNRNFGCWTLFNLSSDSALGNREIQPSFCCLL